MFNRCSIATVSLLALVTTAFSAARAQNLDVGLSALSEHAKSFMPEASAPGMHSQIAKVSDSDKGLTPGRFDEQDRVLVHVLLDGQSSIEDVERQIDSLKGAVLDRSSTYRHGILAAYVPTDQLENAAGVSGVRALVMEHNPVKRAGKFSSQSLPGPPHGPDYEPRSAADRETSDHCKQSHRFRVIRTSPAPLA